jgi:hypothetical protein
MGTRVYVNILRGSRGKGETNQKQASEEKACFHGITFGKSVFFETCRGIILEPLTPCFESGR